MRPDPFRINAYSDLLLKEDTREFTNSPLEHGAFVDGVKNDMHQAAGAEPSIRQSKNNSELSVKLPSGKTYKASVETSMDGIGSKMKHTVRTWTE